MAFDLQKIHKTEMLIFLKQDWKNSKKVMSGNDQKKEKLKKNRLYF